MGRCRFRPVAYRMGLAFVAVGFVLVGLGYGFPNWVRSSSRRTYGLWFTCRNQWRSCHFINTQDVFSWVVRGVLAACLLAYWVTFAVAVRENCCAPNYNSCCLAGRKTEVAAFVAELLGIAGVLLFSLKEYETMGDFRRLSWAHALCDFGLAVSLIGSIMMACAQQSLPAAKAAAGRIVAKPGYESLANGNNNRSASLQSRSTHCTQASPRPAPHISGPYPSPAAIAAVNAAVSPKQSRSAGGKTFNTSQQRKLSSSGPYPPLDAQSSPSHRRKSSGQGKQFTGVHNHSKHPPVFSSQHVQEEWHTQQQQSGGTWSEEMSLEEGGDGVVRQQRALKSQMEQEQAAMMWQQGSTWTAADEGDRSWTLGSHVERQTSHYDRDWRSTSTTITTSHGPQHPKMPPPPAPPSAVAPTNYYAREGYHGYRDYPTDPPPSYPQEDSQWAHPYPQHHISQPHPLHQRPDSGNFPDPPPPEQLLCYEEERLTDTPSYHGYPNPIPGEMLPAAVAGMQPVVLYRAPSQPGESPVTETVAIQPHSRSTTSQASPTVPPHHHRQHPQYQPPPPPPPPPPTQPKPQYHQTFPRQQSAHSSASPNCYPTFGR